MNDSWDEMRRAKEDMYFAEENKRALERLKERGDQNKKRLSPITGEPMEQVNYQGVIIDRCPTSGGIWLDKGELEELIKGAEKQGKEGSKGYLSSLFDFISSSNAHK